MPVPPAAGPFDDAVLVPLKGRKVWVQVNGKSDEFYCKAFEAAGLEVTCDMDNPDQVEKTDLIVRCPELPDNTIALLEAFLPAAEVVRPYRWWSENQCGRYHEITVELPRSPVGDLKNMCWVAQEIATRGQAPDTAASSLKAQIAALRLTSQAGKEAAALFQAGPLAEGYGRMRRAAAQSGLPSWTCPPMEALVTPAK